MEPENTCSECRYCRERGEYHICVRNPPTVTENLHWDQHRNAYFPLVDPDQPVCGEFKN